MKAGRILVGIDFSDGSARAVAEARGLADRLGAALLGLHVVESFGRSGPAGGAPSSGAAVRELEGVELVVRQGFAWMELVRYAREVEPMMIVVGSHGASGFQPLAPGSTAARLGVVSPVPVLVVTAARGAADAEPGAAKVVRRSAGC